MAATVISRWNAGIAAGQSSKDRGGPSGHKVTQQAGDDSSPSKSVLQGGDRKHFVILLLLCSSERHRGKCRKRANSRGEKLQEAGGQLKVKSLVGKEGPRWAARNHPSKVQQK